MCFLCLSKELKVGGGQQGDNFEQSCCSVYRAVPPLLSSANHLITLMLLGSSFLAEDQTKETS